MDPKKFNFQTAGYSTYHPKVGLLLRVSLFLWNRGGLVNAEKCCERYRMIELIFLLPKEKLIVLEYSALAVQNSEV